MADSFHDLIKTFEFIRKTRQVVDIDVAERSAIFTENVANVRKKIYVDSVHFYVVISNDSYGNSEDSDEMTQYAAFHQCLHYSLRQKRHSEMCLLVFCDCGISCSYALLSFCNERRELFTLLIICLLVCMSSYSSYFCYYMGLDTRGYANSKGADQPVHPRSHVSDFVICFLERIITRLATSEISIF